MWYKIDLNYASVSSPLAPRGTATEVFLFSFFFLQKGVIVGLLSYPEGFLIWDMM